MHAKAVVKVTKVDREKRFVCGCVEGKGIDIFYYGEQLSIDCSLFKYIGPGDCVEITYEKAEGKSKQITNIQKWSVNEMRKRIITLVNDAMNLTDQARNEYVTVCSSHKLTKEGKTDERMKAIYKISEEMSRKTDEGLKLFDQRINEIDQEEQRTLDQKNNSLEYQQMIVEKATVLDMINVEKLPAEYLRQYLQEFANDPVAILVMQSSVKGGSFDVIASLPQNNLGMRQETLRGLKEEFREIMENLLLIDDTNDISKRATAENFVKYMECQNDDFSMHQEDVWQAMSNAGSKPVFAANHRRVR